MMYQANLRFVVVIIASDKFLPRWEVNKPTRLLKKPPPRAPEVVVVRRQPSSVSRPPTVEVGN